MIYCSYFTSPGPYESVIKTYLEPSLIRWNLKYKIWPIKDEGSWKANTGKKSSVMLYMLNTYKEDIVFLDADAEIKEFPELFARIPDEYDIACHWLDWDKQYGKRNMPLELLSGTLFWRYDEKAIDLLKLWIEEVRSNPNIWEQKCLHNALKKVPAMVYDLPYEYCAIKKTNGMVPCEKPVILHHQVSRQYRRRKK